jgi:hypothetical protein
MGHNQQEIFSCDKNTIEPALVGSIPDYDMAAECDTFGPGGVGRGPIN